MRVGVVGALLVLGGAFAPFSGSSADERACTVTDCFHERDIRDFEVIDRTTLIVYTGSQRCAFRVELRGTFCDLTFAPDLYFRRPGEVPLGGGGLSGDPTARRTDAFDPIEIARRERKDLRICANDLQIDVDGGRFTDSGTDRPTDRFGNPRSDCQISDVTSITDDQLLELYLKHKVIPPPPPVGQGEIEIGKQKNVSAGE
jgi:hypothetical protein